MKKMLALVCAAVLLLTYVATAIAADAVSPLANCGHANSKVQTNKSQYRALDSFKHEYLPTDVYMCFDCGTVFWTHQRPLETEAHIFKEDGMCVCGAEKIVLLPIVPFPGGN